MKFYLKHKGIVLSRTAVHKYMNKELGLTSIVRRKKLTCKHSEVHKRFDNLINQTFTTPGINQK